MMKLRYESWDNAGEFYLACAESGINEKLAERNVTVMAMDSVPRISAHNRWTH